MGEGHVVWEEVEGVEFVECFEVEVLDLVLCGGGVESCVEADEVCFEVVELGLGQGGCAVVVGAVGLCGDLDGLVFLCCLCGLVVDCW